MTLLDGVDCDDAHRTSLQSKHSLWGLVSNLQVLVFRLLTYVCGSHFGVELCGQGMSQVKHSSGAITAEAVLADSFRALLAGVLHYRRFNWCVPR